MKIRVFVLFILFSAVIGFSYTTILAQDFRKVSGVTTSSPIVGVDKMRDGRIVFGCENGDVFVAKDNNNKEFEKWHSLGEKIKDITVHALNDSLIVEEIIAIAENGKMFRIYRPDQKVAIVLLGVDPNAIHSVPGKTNPQGSVYVVGNNSKVLVSKDGCNTFQEQTTPYKLDHFYSVFFHDESRGWIAGTKGIIYKTYNGGTTWNYVEGDHSNPNYNSIAFPNYAKGYVVGSGGFIGYTSNEGATWAKQNSSILDNLNGLTFGGKDSDYVRPPYAVGDNGTVLTDQNSDGNWEKLNIGTSSKLYDATTDKKGYVWITGENGEVFTNSPKTAPQAPINFAAAPDTDAVHLSWEDQSCDETGFRVERKTDLSTYSQIAVPGPNVEKYEDKSIEDGVKYSYRVCSYNSAGNSQYSNEASVVTPIKTPILTSVKKTNDNKIQIDWKDNSKNETNYVINRKEGSGSYTKLVELPSNSTTYNDGLLSSGLSYYYKIMCYNLIYQSNYSNELGLLFTGIQDREILPKEFALYQNYPNPFNPETIISYDLPKTEHVILKVYDLLGGEVMTLVNKEQTAGRYEVKFSAKKNNLASGVYILRMAAGEFTFVRKMILSK